MPNLGFLSALMGWYGKNNCKLCLELVSGHLGAKTISRKFFFFSLKIDDFSDFFFGKPKIARFGPRNPLGWAPHVVLG